MPFDNSTTNWLRLFFDTNSHSRLWVREWGWENEKWRKEINMPFAYAHTFGRHHHQQNSLFETDWHFPKTNFIYFIFHWLMSHVQQINKCIFKLVRIMWMRDFTNDACFSLLVSAISVLFRSERSVFNCSNWWNVTTEP